MGHEDLPFDDTNTQITGESFVSGYDWSTDEHSHGSHAVGIIAAIGGNDIGVKGVIRNGNVKLHISKVFDASGRAPWSTIIAGFESCVQNGANVVNMSLGGGDYTQSFADAIEDANTAGIVTFASSGNSYGTHYNYPASYPFVLSVGSITESYERSPFSTYNDEVDLCAPGSSVLSTTPNDKYAYYS
jgi:serine protease